MCAAYTRRMRRVLILTAGLACVAGALAFVTGAGAHHRGAPRVAVRPHTGNRTTGFVVSFTAPRRAGRIGSMKRSYQVQASGAGSGCDAAGGTYVSGARKGQRVSVRLAPSGRWCDATFKGTITETERPVCGPAQVCPQFVIDLGTIGRFSFKVSARGS